MTADCPQMGPLYHPSKAQEYHGRDDRRTLGTERWENMVGTILWTLPVHYNQEHTAIVTDYMRPKKIERENRNKGRRDGRHDGSRETRWKDESL